VDQKLELWPTQPVKPSYAKDLVLCSKKYIKRGSNLNLDINERVNLGASWKVGHLTASSKE